MNRCDSRNWENYLWEPVIQTWEAQRTGYSSPVEYRCDLIATQVAQFWESKEHEREYSSREKAYYPVVPSNAQTFQESPVKGRFDFTGLGQTDVLDLIYFRSPLPRQFQAVSLADTIAPLLNKMGIMEDCSTGKDLGTCTLVAYNLVLVARHAVEGHDIRNIDVKFGYVKYKGFDTYIDKASFDCVIEENALCDYAIIQLKEPLGSRLGFVPLNIEGHTIAEPALLHYPLGKPLQVSIHTFVQTPYQADRLLPYHDSDSLSSGGAYFDPGGRMIAMHLGAEIKGDTMNLLRYALPLETIVRRNPHSLLGKLARGELSQAHSYITNISLQYLAPTNHNYLIDEEGWESEKILRGLLTNELKKDKNIELNVDGRIKFSKLNLEYIANKYKAKFDLFEEKCLGMIGLHKFTHLYSVLGVVESDHTIPHAVWKSTTNPKMKTVLAKGGKRPGELEMPAITIPWSIHRKLLTTGGVTGNQAFHQSLTDLCNKGKIDDALIQCYQEYKAKGLNLKAYKSEIKLSLDDHVALGLISNAQKQKIIAAVF